MSEHDDVIEEAAEVIRQRYSASAPDRGGHIAQSLAEAGLLRSPRTEAENAVIAAARHWAVMAGQERLALGPLGGAIVRSVAALDASEGGTDG